QAILERPRGQPFVLPAPKERLDVLALQRAGTHLPEARFTQLTAARVSVRSRSACVAWLPSRLRWQSTRNVYAKSSIEISYRLLSSERNPVSVIANSQSEIPRRDKGQVLRTPVASNEASVVLPAGRSDGPTAKDERGY